MQEDSIVTLAVKVVPRASRNEIVGWYGDHMRVRVAAPPEAGRANAAVEGLLAERLGVARRAVMIVAGQTTARKRVEIRGLSRTEVERRLTAAQRGAT